MRSLQSTIVLLACLMSAALGLAPLGAQQCRPASGGPTCETAGGAASLGDPDGSDLTVGNPIHPITGNKYQEEIDSPPLPGPLALEIRRHFNSSYVAGNTAWGKGWALSYDTRLFRSGAIIQIVQADGRRLVFDAPIPGAVGTAGAAPSATACTSAAPGQGRLFIEADGYRWLWPQQRELLFDRDGNLVQIRPPGSSAAAAVRILRNPAGLITRVTDPAGRSMALDYDSSGHLRRIDHPLGQWQYRINQVGQVESVRAPDGLVRRYRYDDIGHPSRFTAITVAADRQAEQVVGRWAYDAEGRATLYRRGDGGELRMAYQQEVPAQKPGETVSILSNAIGARTTFRASEIAGKWRVTEILGAGCEECGTVNVRMRYDRQAQLLGRWKTSGEGVTYQRDLQGRVVRIVAQPATALTSPGAGTGQDLVQRFEYPDEHSSWPSLVARPSVVPGKEHQVLVRRDERGNIVELTEKGYAPGGSSRPVSGPVPILRSAQLRYEEIAGKRVLVELDGPLPNGPAADPSDSDVTRFRYDDSGNFLLELTSPGGSSRQFVSRDAGGRPADIVVTDGYRVAEEHLSYDLHGQVTRWNLDAWLLDSQKRRIAASKVRKQASRQYDAQGRSVQYIDPAGRVTRFARDAGGRLAGVGDARGYRSEMKRDPEGHVRFSGLYEPGSDEPLRAVYFGRNADGGLASLLLPDGRNFRFHYSRSGGATGFTDAGRLLHLALPAIRQVRSGLVVDDFGQVLEHNLPDHGTGTSRYDEAGRVVQVTDAVGVQTDYVYDAADRLLHTGTAGGVSKASYAYQGGLLIAVDDPAQSTRFTRDAIGRVIQTSTHLAGVAGPPLLVSRLHDPATGLVTQRGLAGGQSIQIDIGSSAEGGTPRRLRLRTAFWTSAGKTAENWLSPALARFVSRLLPRTDIAQDIEVHPFDGLVAFTHGNGIRMSRQFDPAGRTSRLVSRGTGEGVVNWRYRYGTGPRIKAIEHLTEQRNASAVVSATERFVYDAFGTASVAADGVGTRSEPRLTRASVAPKADSDAVVRDKAGRVVEDARFRYAYSAYGQVESVNDLRQGRRIAAYTYNYRGQRTMKRVYDEERDGEQITFYLWIEDQLVAEIDAHGQVKAQYLTLDDGRRNLVIAKLEHNASGSRALRAVHTDHRGAPVAMTDSRQRQVWRADLSPSGEAGLRSMENGSVLNLRLPGQYWDAETGLHDNWHRSYNPRSGRYLQPDPLGYPQGPDPYVYAGGDPVNRIDPFGLYEIDVHYYMTFFLGVTAGLDPEEARIVALAAQYVDNNPLTRPVDNANLGSTVSSVFRNQRQLVSYHFALSGADGQTPQRLLNNRLNSPESGQLQNLLNASRSSALGRNGRLQFLGEYLHALADTYSHRDSNDVPYNALISNCGVGHGYALHEPDLTYDDVHLPRNPVLDEGQPLQAQSWHREARTLAMELNLQQVLLTQGDPAKAKTVQEIEAVLREFNSIRESERTGNLADFTKKIGLLQRELERLGYGSLDLTSLRGFGYDVERAAENRQDFLRGAAGEELTEEAFPGVCLEGGSRCTSS